MTAENFCYWLQGWIEINHPTTIGPDELKEIKNHLSLVTKPQSHLVGTGYSC